MTANVYANEADALERSRPARVESMQAWIIEDMCPTDTKRSVVVIGTEQDAENKAEALGFGDDAWVSGPYDYSIAIKR
jgi:hypothetical protein